MDNNDWEEFLSHDGRIYYINTKTGDKSWDSPEFMKIPDDKCWKTLKTEEGKTYFFNFRTKESKWKKPSTYEEKVEKMEIIREERTAFFQMLSSSVPDDLDPLSDRTPSIYTLKEASVRFDTDPRLVETPSNHRERFIDEWLNLERKRRVYLERIIVEEMMEKVRNRLLEYVKAGTINVDTKWEDVLQLLKLDNNWKSLLNIDRLRVFSEIMISVFDQQAQKNEAQRREFLNIEANRRIIFIQALKNLMGEIGLEVINMCYSEMDEKIKTLPEYVEFSKNIHGSTAVDIFYDVQEEMLEPLESFASSIPFQIEDLDYSIFVAKYGEMLGDKFYGDEEIKYIHQYCSIFQVDKLADQTLRKEERRKNLMRLMKHTPKLVGCSSFQMAKNFIGNSVEYRQINDESEQIDIFNEFVRWGDQRQCEPGEIIEGDSDWEDIIPFLK